MTKVRLNMLNNIYIGLYGTNSAGVQPGDVCRMRNDEGTKESRAGRSSVCPKSECLCTRCCICSNNTSKILVYVSCCSPDVHHCTYICFLWPSGSNIRMFLVQISKKDSFTAFILFQLLCMYSNTSIS